MKLIFASLFLALASCAALANCPTDSLLVQRAIISAPVECIKLQGEVNHVVIVGDPGGAGNVTLNGGKLIPIATVTDDNKAKPKPAPKESKPAPATVEFTPDQAKKLSEQRINARISALEAENLRLNIEAAQAKWVKMRDEAQMKQTAYVELLRALAEKFGVTPQDLPNYEVSDEGGKFTLKRKANAPIPQPPEGKPDTETKAAAAAKKDGEQ